MRKLGPTTVNKLKGYFRTRNITVTMSIKDGNEYIHLIKKKSKHIPRKLIDIVKECIYRYWSGFEIIDENSTEVTLWCNPPRIIVIKDNPNLAFKVGMHYNDIHHKYDCQILQNKILGHVILEFKDEQDATAFRLEYG